nr:MAG TPA: MORC family CW-type zinc finger, histone, chromatin, methylation, methyllysine [Caudoviricetes sp.]
MTKIEVQCLHCGQWHNLRNLSIFLNSEQVEFWQCGGCLFCNKLSESKRRTRRS